MSLSLYLLMHNRVLSLNETKMRKEGKQHLEKSLLYPNIFIDVLTDRDKKIRKKDV